LLFRNIAFAASRKNKEVIDIDDDDDDDNHYQLKPPPPAMYKTSGMYPSPQKTKQKSSGNKIVVDFLSRTVNQVSTRICGTPTTQKTALNVLEDLAKSNNNISKMIISSKAANGAFLVWNVAGGELASFAEQEDHNEHLNFSIVFI
jgi:hypothetical protein